MSTAILSPPEQTAAPRPDLLRDYLTLPQVCAELGITLRCAYLWMSRGDFPPYALIGRVRHFRRAAVAKWLLEREKEPAGE